jgi:hypothetical protein
MEQKVQSLYEHPSVAWMIKLSPLLGGLIERHVVVNRHLGPKTDTTRGGISRVEDPEMNTKSVLAAAFRAILTANCPLAGRSYYIFGTFIYSVHFYIPSRASDERVRYAMPSFGMFWKYRRQS